MGLTTGVRSAHQARSGRKVPAEWRALVVSVAVTVIIGLLLPYEADRVAVVIENPTDHVLYVHASSPDDASLTMVGVFSPQSTNATRDVIDRGQRWVLHVQTGGASSGVVEVSRRELLSGSFKIPDEFASDGVSGLVADRSVGDSNR